MAKDDIIHIAIPAEGKAYEFYAHVTAESAKRGSSLPVEIHFIGEEDFKRVLRSSTSNFNSFSNWHGSLITWSRLYLPELFPDLDWIISADADIMFRGDVAELWDIRSSPPLSPTAPLPWIYPSCDNPLPGKSYNESAINWYRERGLRFERPKEYFCAGLAVFNLKAMREGGWAQLRDDFLSRHSPTPTLNSNFSPMPNADQCVLNYLLQDKKQLLPCGWGVFSGDENADIDWRKSGAVHFVEDTPWNRWKITHLESDLVVEWKRLANELGGHYRWRNWRRLAFLFLKHNQRILKLHPKLWLHLRSTRGVRV